ncbi:phytanoyl-CoA dioxygenase family protein [Falsiroseomonas sp. HW251]|uniref:phytanoyl-CoA dioxygenase family protein n=1 Tax=Falsiroseomonas sp. HW251 TaxID=3390998 RepID=UPI003D3217E3
MDPVSRYGVRMALPEGDALDEAAESLRLLGFAVVDSGLDAAALDALRRDFDALRAARTARFGAARLAAIGEAELLRCPLAESAAFLSLAANPAILALCERLIGPGFVLNQQNGIVNPAGAQTYSQSPWHRDLPYQHFVSSRPLAINALFCLDEFTLENGATHVLPASHKEEAFPSAALIRREARQVAAPAGCFIVLDCMAYHRGGVNRSGMDRRAVNHLYGIAILRQQIDLPAALGEGFTADPALRQLLGLAHPQPRSVEEYYAIRERKC